MSCVYEGVIEWQIKQCKEYGMHLLTPMGVLGHRHQSQLDKIGIDEVVEYEKN